ncbi:hypothetical protein AgCh_028760 [Apium graveolens]
MGAHGVFDLEKHFAFYGAYHSNKVNILIHTSLLAQLLGFSLAWKVVLVVQLVCWTGQFIGHGVFEKRAPALLDNLLQAFLLAPFFVLLEALQNCFSYEPYRGFHHTVKAKIEADINEWQNKKQNLLS